VSEQISFREKPPKGNQIATGEKSRSRGGQDPKVKKTYISKNSLTVFEPNQTSERMKAVTTQPGNEG